MSPDAITPDVKLDKPFLVCQSSRLGGLSHRQSLSGTVELPSTGSEGLEETASGRTDVEDSCCPGRLETDLSESRNKAQMEYSTNVTQKQGRI